MICLNITSNPPESSLTLKYNLPVHGAHTLYPDALLSTYFWGTLLGFHILESCLKELSLCITHLPFIFTALSCLYLQASQLMSS